MKKNFYVQLTGKKLLECQVSLQNEYILVLITHGEDVLKYETMDPKVLIKHIEEIMKKTFSKSDRTYKDDYFKPLSIKRTYWSTNPSFFGAS